MVSIEESLKDPSIIGIMKTVENKYSKNIDPDQLESIKLNTLWECTKKYDETRGAKFTSFLYQQLTFAFKNELKRKKKEFSTENIEIIQPVIKNNQDTYELMDGVPCDMKKIILQKYIYNMTMVEIGRANGYSRETARRKLQKAVKFFKQKNKTHV